MRTTKVMAFSVPPDFEDEIQKHAKAEHRTISEYLEKLCANTWTCVNLSKPGSPLPSVLRKKGRKPADVDAALSRLRKRR